MPHRLIDFQTDPAAGGEPIAAEGAEQRPEWLLSKFASRDEQARAYAEAEKEMARLRDQTDRQAEEFQTALQALQAEQERQTQSRIDPASDPRLIAYQDAVDRGDAAAQLAITLHLNQQMIQQELQSRQQELNPQMDAIRAAQRDSQITQAEGQARQYAIDHGLNYDASLQDVRDALTQLYGPQVLPAEGDVASYAEAMKRGIDIVRAQAIIARDQTDEGRRREVLSAMTTVPGASGRQAQDTPQAREEWAKIMGANDGSYASLMRPR